MNPTYTYPNQPDQLMYRLTTGPKVPPPNFASPPPAHDFSGFASSPPPYTPIPPPLPTNIMPSEPPLPIYQQPAYSSSSSGSQSGSQNSSCGSCKRPYGKKKGKTQVSRRKYNRIAMGDIGLLDKDSKKKLNFKLSNCKMDTIYNDKKKMKKIREEMKKFMQLHELKKAEIKLIWDKDTFPRSFNQIKLKNARKKMKAFIKKHSLKEGDIGLIFDNNQLQKMTKATAKTTQKRKQNPRSNTNNKKTKN